MSGERSVHSDEASKFRKVLEKPSPDSTYSPRTELLSEDDSHKAHRTKTHGASSHKKHHSRSHRHRERGAAADIISLEPRHLSRLLAREELEAIDMRKVLIQTSQRLEQETRRATEAEARAREAEARVLALQADRQVAKANAQREQETLKAYHAQIEVARNEILRAQKELDDMAAEKAQAEEEAAKERSKARAMAKEIEIKRAYEEGREEGKNQGFMDGRKEGWHLGTRQGIKEAYREMGHNDDASVSSRSSTPPPANPRQNPTATSTTNQSAGRPPPAGPPDTNTRPPSTRSATTQTRHKHSGSLTQLFKPRHRVNSDPKPPPSTQNNPPSRPATNTDRTDSRSRPTSTRLGRSPSRESVLTMASQNHPSTPQQRHLTPSPRARMSPLPAQNRSSTPRPDRLSPSPSREQISPIPVQNRPSTPRHSTSSPLPSGFIPLQENGRVSLPPPHELEPPPPSPHTPAPPLPPDLIEVAPTITVQEPTPPEPPLRIPDSTPGGSPSRASTENNIRPSQVLAREQAMSSRSESPPLPPLPGSSGTEQNKGKQRQRTGPPRTGPGLHAPGRSSPSDTSTEFSQFDIVEQPERVRGFGMGRSNGSQLSVIMEGGSSIAESPEPERGPSPRTASQPATRVSMTQPPPPPPTTQGILNDPREYGELSDIPLTPTQLAHRRLVADQLRNSPSDEERRNQARSARDDVSIRSSTTRTSAPRRRPNLKMPERLAASKDVEALEKQAEMYDAFGTGRSFPTFDSQSSPDDASLPTRSPQVTRRTHRRSSSTTVPEITIQPPSRPSSKDSKLRQLASEQPSAPMPAAGSSSRRHSLQSPLTPSRVPLPMTNAQVPLSLGTPQLGELGLPPGFVPNPGQSMPNAGASLPNSGPSVPMSMPPGPSMPMSMPPGPSMPMSMPPGPSMPMTPSRIPLPQSSAQLPMSLGTPFLADMNLPPGFVPMHGPPEVLEAFSSTVPSQSPGMETLGMTGALSLHDY